MLGWEILEAIILGVVQGVAEFLPISSSGHLVVVQELLRPLIGENADRSGSLELNIALHLGTLFSILAVYQADLKQLRSRPRDILAIGVATVPIVIVGLCFKDAIKRSFEVPLVAGIGLLVTSGLLIVGQRLERGDKTIQTMSMPVALTIGLFQALAVVPGISRSGSTIAGGLLAGLRRETSATFSFLIAIPAISGAGVLIMKDILEGQSSGRSIVAPLVGALTAFVVGYYALRWLLKLISQRKLHWFAIYCAALGTLVIVWQVVV